MGIIPYLIYRHASKLTIIASAIEQECVLSFRGTHQKDYFSAACLAWSDMNGFSSEKRTILSVVVIFYCQVKEVKDFGGVVVDRKLEL